jgi:hypothetical protein
MCIILCHHHKNYCYILQGYLSVHISVLAPSVFYCLFNSLLDVLVQSRRNETAGVLWGKKVFPETAHGIPERIPDLKNDRLTASDFQDSNGRSGQAINVDPLLRKATVGSRVGGGIAQQREEGGKAAAGTASVAQGKAEQGSDGMGVGRGSITQEEQPMVALGNSC